MICPICRQAEIVDGFSAVNFERGEMHLLIKNVPAHVCPSCGEAYVGEDVASQLLRIAKEMSDAGVLDAYCEYSTFKFDTIVL
jgi:YgiT-type zinc finger domain-containing protein